MPGEHPSGEDRRTASGDQRASATDDPRRWPVRRDVSAGGAAVRRSADGWEVALVRPAGRTDRKQVWALPKGLVEPGERFEDAAVREVREETGLDAEPAGLLEEVNYWYTWAPDRVRVRKTVHFYLMRVVGGDTEAHDAEVEEVRFVPVARAPKVASYTSERKALRRAAEIVAQWDS